MARRYAASSLIALYGGKAMRTMTIQRSLTNEAEAARVLHLSVKTLRRWRWAGKGPRFLKIGGAVRYDPADLEAFIDDARRTSTSDDGTAVRAREASNVGA